MAKKILNIDLEVLGKLNLSTVPNTAGDILTFDGLNQVSKRTASQILSDIGAAALFHNHVEADITDLQPYLLSVDISDINSTGTADATTYLRGDGSWQTVASSGGTWGSITGTLSAQTDLQTALDGKVDIAGDTMTGALTINSGASQPLILQGSGLIGDDTAQCFIQGKDSAGSNLWYLGDGNPSNSDTILYNYKTGQFLRLAGTGGSSGFTFYDGLYTGTVWHSRNDGSGSGLDADTVDGLQSSSFVRTDANNVVGNHTTDFRGSTRWVVSSSDSAHQRCDARDEGTEARLHWYGVNTSGTAVSAKHAFYDGSSYVNMTAQSGTVAFSSTLTASNFILTSDRNLKENITPYSPKSIDINLKTFEWKQDKGNGRTQLGVIAQELEVKHPEFVLTNDEGVKSVAYIDLLLAKNAELERRLERLENMLNQ